MLANTDYMQYSVIVINKSKNSTSNSTWSLKDKNYIPISIILVSILLRFWFFWRPSFSGDEGEYVSKAVQILRGINDLVLGRDIHIAIQNIFLPILQHAHGPLEFLLAIPMAIFQPREFFVRLIFVVIGSVVLILSFLILKKLRNINVATAFAVTFGTSVYAIWWSQTAMYQSLSMAASIFIFLSVLYFLKKPSRKTLILLFLSPAVGLLVFPDFALFVPAIIWVAYDKRKYLKITELVLAVGVFLIVAGVYYFPWIIYSIISGNQYAGFNFLLKAKLAARVDVYQNLQGFWNNFFSFPGVYTVWPFAILSTFLIKKVNYLKYVLLTVFLATLVYIFRAYTPYFYFVSIFAPICILASEWIASQKRLGKLILVAILILNLFSITLLLKGEHNPLIFGQKGHQLDEAKQVGMLAKKCIVKDDETYISTYPTGKAAYYFGRQSTAYYDGSEMIPKMKQFLEGKAESVKLIHYSRGFFLTDKNLEEQLRGEALQIIEYKDDVALLYKDCD